MSSAYVSENNIQACDHFLKEKPPLLQEVMVSLSKIVYFIIFSIHNTLNTCKSHQLLPL